MTESLSSLCRTLTPEGGYQLRDSVLARVEYIGRIGQGRAGQGHRAQGQEGTHGTQGVCQSGPRGGGEECRRRSKTKSRTERATSRSGKKKRRRRMRREDRGRIQLTR